VRGKRVEGDGKRKIGGNERNSSVHTKIKQKQGRRTRLRAGCANIKSEGRNRYPRELGIRPDPGKGTIPANMIPEGKLKKQEIGL